ncbi:uncharacterized protein LOC105692731 [Athalia rosae]|uniref:uncharacterized protein LOC105692731 n=1 Tax=Athalia rosae TaxID=37344 RepID=UPI0020344D5D|nr:uncharacterized protein LOC105692731 [Athalia rosae]
MKKETVNNMIKACIVSRKGGVLLKDIDREYESLVGERIPYTALGYKTLLDYITSIDCVDLKQNFVGDQVLSVCDPKIAHIDSLVKKQKNPSNRGPPKKKGFGRKNRSPVPYYKSSRYGKKSPDHRPRYKESRNTAEFGPNKFKNNTRMEYAQSKWYSDRNCFRSKDYWTKEKKESRQINRLDNFNAGRPGMQYYDDDYNDNFGKKHSSRDSSKNNSWNSKSTSISNIEIESTYNPARYRESEQNSNWRFRIQVADGGSTMDVSLQPLVNGHQLIGDDFFLQLAKKNLGAETWRAEARSAIKCGLCISGQTIDECRQRLEKTQYLSGSVVILLGAVDIFRGNSLDRMVTEMKRLLEVCRNRFNMSEIILCTIPPLANYSVKCDMRKLSVFYSFNNWIRLQGDFVSQYQYKIIDLFEIFTTANHRTLYDYFQSDATTVSGCPYPHVLWNISGRRVVISLLQRL